MKEINTEVAMITDLHWGVRNNSQFFLEQMKKFYYECFIPYCLRRDIKTIWILGDVFENRKQINVLIMQELISFFSTLQNYGFTVYCIAGNHDFYFKNTDAVCSLTSTVSSFSNVRVINRREVHSFDGVNVGFINWIFPDDLEESVRWMNTVPANILCGHFAINNFEIARGTICEGGMDSSTFSRFDRVFSGHFHIKAQSGNITYLGNPYQTNWGEAGYTKGFHIFTPKTNILEFIPNPKNIYETVHYTDSTNTKDIDFDYYKDKIVRVMVPSGEGKNKKKLEFIIDGLTDNAFNVEVIDNKDVFMTENNEHITDTIEIMKKFLDECSLENIIDKALLQSLLFDIYNEAVQKGTL